MTVLRWLGTLSLIALAVIAGAPFIRSFGFGGWVVSLLLSVALPFLASVVAKRFVWFAGTMASFALPASFFLHDHVLKSNPIYVGGADRATLTACAGMSLVQGMIGTFLAHLLIRSRGAAHGPRGFEVAPRKQ